MFYVNQARGVALLGLLNGEGTFLSPPALRAVKQGAGMSPLLWPSAWFDGAVFLLRSIVNQVFVEKT